jgi:C-terminal processing protease CtpA/Prc
MVTSWMTPPSPDRSTRPLPFTIPIWIDSKNETPRAELLTQQFDFSEDDNFLVARNKEPWPKDDLEAAKLWRQRIKYELLQSKLSKEKPEDAIGLISRRYNRLQNTMKEFENDEILQMYLTALAHCYDPHSDYMSPSEAANFDIQHISLSLTESAHSSFGKMVIPKSAN